MGLRFSFVIVSLVATYGYLLFHVYDLQVTQGQRYVSIAGSQEAALRLFESQRGTIYFIDKNGNRLRAATTKYFPVVYAEPKIIDDPREVAHRLAPVLGIEAEELETKLARRDSYELLERKVSPATADAVKALGIKGIHITTTPLRFYPFGELAAHALGFVAPDDVGTGEGGRYGVEEYYDAELSGNEDGADGEDITLTIDLTVQIEAERILEDVVKRYNAAGGSIIVADPRTGEIRAMGSMPRFDPNNYGIAALRDFINPTTQQIYEPGSVFKVLTMVAGIDSGALSPQTTYYDRGSLTLNGRTIQNYDLFTKGPYGTVTMTNVIEHSINTGAVFAQQQTGRETFIEYMQRFGFGEKTGITLPGEVRGDIRRLNPSEGDITFATASYGQGVAVTPLEIVRAFSAIANGGVMMQPYIDASKQPVVLRRVMAQETARQVAAMMVSAVDKAKIPAINGYSLAGKTGTAFVPDFERGGYTDNVINTYVGFGPVSDPQFLILIKLVDPEGAPVAGLSVVPAFRDFAQFLLNYYNIPPDRITPP